MGCGRAIVGLTNVLDYLITDFIAGWIMDYERNCDGLVCWCTMELCRRALAYAGTFFSSES